MGKFWRTLERAFAFSFKEDTAAWVDDSFRKVGIAILVGGRGSPEGREETSRESRSEPCISGALGLGSGDGVSAGEGFGFTTLRARFCFEDASSPRFLFFADSVEGCRPEGGLHLRFSETMVEVASSSPNRVWIFSGILKDD